MDLPDHISPRLGTSLKALSACYGTSVCWKNKKSFGLEKEMQMLEGEAFSFLGLVLPLQMSLGGLWGFRVGKQHQPQSLMIKETQWDGIFTPTP